MRALYTRFHVVFPVLPMGFEARRKFGRDVTRYLRIIESLRDGLGHVENSSAIAAHHKDEALRSLEQDKLLSIMLWRTNR